MKKIITLVVVMLVVGLTNVVMAGDVETHDGTNIGGTVPFCASWDLVEPNSNAFSDVDISVYDSDFLEVTELIKIADFDCNTKFKITATKTGWTLPAHYNQNDGNKRTNGSDTDFGLKIDIVNPGYESDGLTAINGYGNGYYITTSGSDILKGGKVGEGVGHGVENAACNIHGGILMDWATDIVGNYSLTVTLTISELNE